MKTIRVAALQLAAHDRAELDRARPAIMKQIDAAAADADLLVVPEGTFPAYVLGYEPLDRDELERDARTLAAIAQARSCVIVIGMAQIGECGTTNAAVAFDNDGRIAGYADKVFLWHFDRQWFVPGTRVGAVDTSIGRIGMLVCADGRMPAIARALVDDGAQMLVMPTAWVTSGRDATSLENVQADLLARVRAFENGVAFVAANKCGVERGMVAYCGKSQIVRPDGSIAALASERNAEIISASIEVTNATPHRSEWKPSVCHSEPRSLRVALSLETMPNDAAQRMRILETSLWLGTHVALPQNAMETLAGVAIDDREPFDPLTGIRARVNGYRTLVWRVAKNDPWTVTIARARALELRMYVIVFEPQRAYAVDPDGAIVCGTFDAFSTASFAFDASKTSATLLVPGTDVAEGMQRIESMVRP